jgi:hypothetical protein
LVLAEVVGVLILNPLLDAVVPHTARQMLGTLQNGYFVSGGILSKDHSIRQCQQG